MGDSIPAGARPIPGTDYQVAGATIYRPDGQSVSKEEATRELGNVSLPSASVTVMQGVYGPDFGKSTLPSEGAQQVSAGALATTLEDKSETMVVDLKAVLVLLFEITKLQRDTTAKARDAQFAVQIDSLKEAAEEAMAAARARMITGIVVGSVTSMMGGLSVLGGYSGMKAISTAQEKLASGEITKATSNAFNAAITGANNTTQIFQSIGQTGQSLGQIGSSVGEGIAASAYDKASKDADIEAKADEQMVALIRDMVTAQMDMLSAVRSALRDMQEADAEASRAAAKV